MANYPLNPVPFIPPGFSVEPGPADRLVRGGMVVNPIAPLNHDFTNIVRGSQSICSSALHQRAAIHNTVEGLLHESQLFTTEPSDRPVWHWYIWIRGLLY